MNRGWLMKDNISKNALRTIGFRPWRGWRLQNLLGMILTADEIGN